MKTKLLLTIAALIAFAFVPANGYKTANEPPKTNEPPIKAYAFIEEIKRQERASERELIKSEQELKKTLINARSID